MAKVSVVIPNYNGEKFIDECFEALCNQNFKDFDVILVDNGSKDSSVKMSYAYSDRLDFKTVLLDQNYGFPKAVNEGIKASTSEFVILLNNDTKADCDFVGNLVKAIERDDKIFSAQALMLKYDNPKLADDAGDFYCALGWAFARGKDKPAKKYRRGCDVFAACAGAAIYRRAVFEEIGYFEEEFFAYLEDIDVGYRARLFGYRNIFAPKAKVLHVGSGASGSRYNDFKVSLSAQNSILLMYKNFTKWQWALNAVPVGLGIIVKLVFFARKGFVKSYLKGLVLAIGKTKKVRRTELPDNLKKNYFVVEKELLINTLRRIGLDV